MSRVPVFLLGVLCSVWSPPCFAWGDEGHRAVAMVAQEVLKARSPQTLVALQKLIGTMPLSSVATCPDELRAHDRKPMTFHFSPVCQKVFGGGGPGKTDDWHFIDLDVNKGIPPTDQVMDQQFCQNSDCVVARILSFEQVLAGSGPGNRLQALAFVVHFVGDVHQPLHAAERGNDHGGNAVLVGLATGGRHQVTEEKLHGAWDTNFVKDGAGDEATFVADINPQIAVALQEKPPAAQQFPSWVHNWARESEKLAIQDAYVDSAQPLPVSGHVLSSKYEDDADAIVKSQIAKAGVRLAVLLSAAVK